MALLLLPTLAVAEPATPAVTKSFMRQIASGKIKPANLVDADVGVVVVVYAGGIESEDPPQKTAHRMCGVDAERAIRHAREHLKLVLDLGDALACSNRPRPACTAAIAGELGTKNEYVFRPNPDGDLILDTLITTNSTHPAPNEAKVVARLRAKHIGGTCS